MSIFFEVKKCYDYSKSSELNYASPHAAFVGDYVKQRAQLDYSYHTRYSEDRQLLQVQNTTLFKLRHLNLNCI